jgi:hypothetical protein
MLGTVAWHDYHTNTDIHAHKYTHTLREEYTLVAVYRLMITAVKAHFSAKASRFCPFCGYHLCVHAPEVAVSTSPTAITKVSTVKRKLNFPIAAI